MCPHIRHIKHYYWSVFSTELSIIIKNISCSEEFTLRSNVCNTCNVHQEYDTYILPETAVSSCIPVFLQSVRVTSYCNPSSHIWLYTYKIYMGTPCKLYGDLTFITQRHLQKVDTLNKYHFPIFIYYKETIKKLATHIN